MTDRSKEVFFVIEGDPRGKERPRTTFKGGTRTYTPQMTVIYENLVKLMYREACGAFKFGDDDPIDLRIFAYYSIPKSASKKKRELMLAGKIRPTKKPDVDNIEKIVADALNQFAYKDDSQIVDTMVRKFYDEKPRVEVMIRVAE